MGIPNVGINIITKCQRSLAAFLRRSLSKRKSGKAALNCFLLWYWRRVGLKQILEAGSSLTKSCIWWKEFHLPECLEQWQLVLFIVALIPICLLIFLISACMHTNRLRAVFSVFTNKNLFIVTELNYGIRYLSVFVCLWVQFNPSFIFFLHCSIFLLFTIWCGSARSG